MLPDAVARYIRSNRDKLLSQLCELLRIRSISNDASQDDQCTRAAEWLARCAEAVGMRAEIVPTAGKPAVIAAAEAGPDSPTLLVYCHYDVQPPDPLEEWSSPPFEPTVRDGRLYARGACDDKGPLMAYLMAVEAWQQAGRRLPVNVKFFIEGEEEIGSPNVEAFVLEHREKLRADAVVVPDTSFFASDVPSVTYGLRGLAYFEVTMTGALRDVHSGLYGGAVGNPVHALAALVAAMHDADGRLTLEGFYDDVLEITDEERRAWAKLPFDEADYAAAAGVGRLSGGERGFSVLERLWARPSADCNGIVGGYVGPGAKTIIPSRASAKISMRLVPNQDPQKIVASFRKFVAGRTPAGMKSSVAVHATSRPVLARTDSPVIRAACRAIEEAFGGAAALIRCGASVPATECIQRILGVDVAIMGVTLPENNHHAPNENYSLDMLTRSAVAAAALFNNLRE